MTPPLPLRPTTVRFAEDGMELVQRAADKVGCNFGQFCREAALMRAVIVLEDDYEMSSIDSLVRQIDEEGNGERRADAVKKLSRRSDPSEGS